MLTYAAIKFTCEPRSIFLLRTRHHLHFGRKFFYGKVMCEARWKCKQICYGSKRHLDEDDFRPAEVLLMGNSRESIIDMLRQCHPKLDVIEPNVSITMLDRSNDEHETKLMKKDELVADQSTSAGPCKKIKLQHRDSEEIIQNQRQSRRVSFADELAAATPSKRRRQSNEIGSFKDHNENAIADNTNTAAASWY